MNDKTYTFEYTDKRNAKIYAIIAGVLLFAVPVFTIIFIDHSEATVVKAFLVAIGLLIIQYFVFPKDKSIKRMGSATLTADEVTFRLFRSTHTVPFDHIKDYLIQEIQDAQNDNRLTIRLNLKNEKKIEINAGGLFTQTDTLKVFAQELENAIQQYNLVQHPISRVQEAPNPWAKKWIYNLSIVMLVMLAILVIPVVIYGDAFRFFIFTIHLGTALAVYSIAKKARGKETDKSLNTKTALKGNNEPKQIEKINPDKQ